MDLTMSSFCVFFINLGYKLIIIIIYIRRYKAIIKEKSIVRAVEMSRPRELVSWSYTNNKAIAVMCLAHALAHIHSTNQHTKTHLLPQFGYKEAYGWKVIKLNSLACKLSHLTFDLLTRPLTSL